MLTGKVKRTLVVDNDKDACQVISDVLRKEGFKTNVAYDARTALAKIKRNQIDVMILDYQLSGISGLIVLKKARQSKPSIKTIMISGHGDYSTKLRAKRLGAYDFLDKPFDINRLVTVVKRASRQKQEKMAIAGMQKVSMPDGERRVRV